MRVVNSVSLSAESWLACSEIKSFLYWDRDAINERMSRNTNVGDPENFSLKKVIEVKTKAAVNPKTARPISAYG